MKRLRTIVFNNPFGSFDDTVANAKEEREQLDRLLTITTPRERLLLAGAAVLLLILVAWMFLGSVARTIAVHGVLVEPGEERVEGPRTVEALVWVRNDVASHLGARMPAVIELGTADGEAARLGGVVAGVSAEPLPEGLAELASAPATVHRVEIALDEGIESASLAGRECRVVIETGRQAPVTLFGMRRP